MTRYRLDHGEPLDAARAAHDRAGRSLAELVHESIDKAIDAEKKELLEKLIEAKHAHAAAIEELTARHDRHNLSFGLILASMLLAAMVGSAAMTWAVMKFIGI